MKRLTRWGKVLVLAVLSLALVGPASAQLAGTPPLGARSPGARPPGAKSPAAKPPVKKPPAAKPAAKEPVVVTDYGMYLGELRSAGALKFYDNTEELLRLAQFERALMRYRFLKGQIQGKVDYYGLISMVNYRLQFLKRQLHLRDVDVAGIPPRRVRMLKAKRAVKLSETLPPVKPGAAKSKTPGEADKEANQAKIIPGVNMTPTAPTQVQAVAPIPVTPKPPPVVTTDTPSKEEAAQEEKPEKPVVPPSFWQRVKLRLHLGKKPTAPAPPAASSD